MVQQEAEEDTMVDVMAEEEAVVGVTAADVVDHLAAGETRGSFMASNKQMVD